jgi:two-component system, response regulator PdtaR
VAQSPCLKFSTILIVENEAIVRLELADWLAEMGLGVLAAANADEAVALLDLHPEIEALITGIKMPGAMDGVALAHHVRDRRPLVRIIVESGVVDTQLSELPDGAVFVPKPFEPQKLWQALAPFADGGRPNSLGCKAA